MIAGAARIMELVVLMKPKRINVITVRVPIAIAGAVRITVIGATMFPAVQEGLVARHLTGIAVLAQEVPAPV